MSFRSFRSKPIGDFRGAWLDTDNVELQPNRASLARNVRFKPGQVLPRPGYVAGLAVDAKITSMYNWITGLIQRLVRYRGLNYVEMVDLSNNTVTALYTVAARGLSIAEAGTRVYIGHYDSNNAAVGQVHVVNALIGGIPVDIAFAAPMSITGITITDVGAGFCTPGPHQFGYIMETRTGFVGSLGPWNGSGIFSPTTYTVVAGTGRKLQMSFTGNIPADAAYIHPIMTRTDNPNEWYFIPGASVAVPGGATGWTVTVQFSYSDATLSASAGNLATDHQFYLTQSNLGSGPISPSAVRPCGNRVCYICDNKAYFSEPNDFQVITEDSNVKQVEGQRKLTTGESIRGVYYLFGPNWTYSTQDNGDLPVLWGSPKLVSNAIGAKAPTCVSVSVNGQYAWVAAESGFYFFNGQYDDMPVNYLQLKDWARINWAAATTIQITDNPIERIAYVLVPLDGATEPNYQMTFDYSRAKSSSGSVDPLSVDYCLDDYNSATSISSIALVQDYATGKRSIWLGPAAAGNILKQSVGSTDDAGAAIHQIWESGLVLLPSDPQAQLNTFAGMHSNVTGVGTLLATIFGLNRVKSVGPRLRALAVAPGQEVEVKFDLLAENASIRFETNAVGEWFNLSNFKPYWAARGTNR